MFFIKYYLYSINLSLLIEMAQSSHNNFECLVYYHPAEFKANRAIGAL